MSSLNIQTPKGENGFTNNLYLPEIRKKLENTLRRMELHFSFEIGPPVCKSTAQKQKNIYENTFHVFMLFLKVHFWEERCVMRKNIFPSWRMQV